MKINDRVLGMPVSLSPLDKSIKEFKRAVLKLEAELKVSIYSDCLFIVPNFNFLRYFSIGTTDMENVGPMEKRSLEGQRYQRSVDDDGTSIHRARRTVWKTMVQTPGSYFVVSEKLNSCPRFIMLLPNLLERDHTDIWAFTA